MMKFVALMAAAGFACSAAAAGSAGAAELKVLSVDALKPALQELAKDFEKSSKDKLKIDYDNAAGAEKKVGDEEEYDVVILDHAAIQKLTGAAKLAGGAIKPVAKQNDQVFEATTTNWTQQPLACEALINFLATPKAAEVYKAKGLQPG